MFANVLRVPQLNLSFFKIIRIKIILTGSGSNGSFLEYCVQLFTHCLSNDVFAASYKLGYTVHRQKDPEIHRI